MHSDQSLSLMSNYRQAVKHSTFFAGVDVGSSSVRVGLIDSEGTLQRVESVDVGYIVDVTNKHFVTQSSTDIVNALEICLGRLSDCEIVSVSVAATCSMAVFKRTGTVLEPYSVTRDGLLKEQNVVFWMDSRADKETTQLNSILKEDRILDFYGGSLITEMALPKVKHLVDNTPETDLANLVFLDLHSYLTHYLLRKRAESSSIISLRAQRSIDCELQGWNADFLNRIGLKQLASSNFKALALFPYDKPADYHPLILAGSPLGLSSTGITVSQGIIDSYAGFLGSVSSLDGTLGMVAGTSTCFILAHNKPDLTIPGIWGPFEGVVPFKVVSEGGQSTTGKLIEHLFEMHPAHNTLQETYDDVFNGIESEIKKIEEERGQNIHFVSRYAYLYGDLSGNRTPFADSSMRGVWFGESTDTGVTDLVIKFIATLEFLAFQTKQIVDLFRGGDTKVNKICICGSQAKNKRLVQLIADITKVPVEVSSLDPDLAGVRGAAYLGMAGIKGIPVTEIISNFTKPGKVCEPKSSTTLEKLLLTKYRVNQDIALRQRTYNSWVDSIID